MRVLITGVNGFAGSWLAKYIITAKGTTIDDDIELYGIDYTNDFSRLERLNIKHEVNFKLVDICNRDAVHKFIRDIKPDKIFHLAALIAVDKSFDFPWHFFEVNVGGTLNVLDAVRLYSSKTAVLVAGSSEEYGLVKENEVPIREFNEMRPLSPYAVSKIAAERITQQYARTYNLRATATRAFNHFGPLQGTEAAIANWADQIVNQKVKEGDSPVISVGNLSAKRDFTDVRDIVRAYWRALEKVDDMGDMIFNIASGKTKTMKDWLDMLISEFLVQSGMEVKIKVDPERMRPSDVPILLGSYDKIKGFMGWQPEISAEETIKDVVKYSLHKE